MHKVVTRSPMCSFKTIQAKLIDTVTVVSTKTIQRRLSLEFGLKSRKLARKPRLTEAMKKKRLDFAKRHADWNTEIWKRVHFSDESSLSQFSVRKYRVRRLAGARHKEKYTLPTVKHPPSQMVWGAMSSIGTAGLYFLPPEQPRMVKNK